MKKIILIVLVLIFSSMSTYADALTDLLKTFIGKKVIVDFIEKESAQVTGILQKVDDKFLYIEYSTTGDYIVLRDAIARIYLYKK